MIQKIYLTMKKFKKLTKSIISNFKWIDMIKS